MLYGPETLPLFLEDITNNTKIHFYIEHYSLLYEQDYENDIQIEQRTNQVECYYSFSDDDGWGSVSEVYMLTSDIEKLADNFRKLLYKQLTHYEFESEISLFTLCVDHMDNGYNLSFSIDDGLTGEWITVDLQSLTDTAFEEYANVFIQWGKDYPVLSEEELSVKYRRSIR